MSTKRLWQPPAPNRLAQFWHLERLYVAEMPKPEVLFDHLVGVGQ